MNSWLDFGIGFDLKHSTWLLDNPPPSNYSIVEECLGKAQFDWTLASWIARRTCGLLRVGDASGARCTKCVQFMLGRCERVLLFWFFLTDLLRDFFWSYQIQVLLVANKLIPLLMGARHLKNKMHLCKRCAKNDDRLLRWSWNMLRFSEIYNHDILYWSDIFLSQPF